MTLFQPQRRHPGLLFAVVTVFVQSGILRRLPVVSSWSFQQQQQLPSSFTSAAQRRRRLFLVPPRLFRLSTRASTTTAAGSTSPSASTSMDDTASNAVSLPSEHHILSYVPFLSSTVDNDSSDTNAQRVKLILASQSPRRREILDMMGLKHRFQVIPSPLQEEEVQVHYSASLSPTDYTRRLAEEKALALAETLTTSTTASNNNLPTLILGSDTIVELHGNILEKPKHVADARNMLRQLSAQEHQVHTGVALYLVSTTTTSDPATTTSETTTTASSIRLLSSFTDTAWVQFASLSAQDIEAYVATGEPLDKAGSYGIQGVGGQFVTKITGDFFTVMGLPAHRTSQALAKAMADLVVVDDEQ